jgi:Cu+-exporting ATPase
LKKVVCDHCHLEFDEDVMIEEIEGEERRYFCCKGCQGVYHLLKDEGLETFYDKVGDTKLHPAAIAAADLQKFDSEGFYRKYVKEHTDGLCEVHLIIEGIHCSACVWLNEKVLHRTDGIIEAEINFTNHKAKIVWDPELLKLSDIITKIQSIGYNAYPYDAALQEERINKVRRDYYARLLVGVFATMNIMWIAIAQYTGYFTGMDKSHKNILNIAEFLLATPTLFYTGWVFYRGAFYGLKNRFINMDFLVATGATLAYIYSIYAMITQHGEVYFDSVTMIITFIFVGKYLEVLSKKRAVDTLDAMTGSLPTEVIVIEKGQKQLRRVEEVHEGDIIEVTPGDRIVIDGEIVNGEASFDESSLTGESVPVHKVEGDEIISGSVCLDAVVRYRAIKSYEKSMLSTIVTLLEESMTKKPKIEKLANEISGYFSVTILLIALLTFGGWYYFEGSFEHALIVAISVIVIACPCALGLATPVATLVGLGEGAKRGILFKEATFLETMAKSDLLLLDKTGTITEGKPEVIGYEEVSPYDVELLYALVSSSKHPVSQGVKRYLEENHTQLKAKPLENIKNIEARGIEAVYEGKKIAGGSARLLQERGISVAFDSDKSLFALIVDGDLKAYFYLRDRPKEGAKEAIDAVKKMGLEVVMLTGDVETVAKKIAAEVGIDKVHASLFPKDKADIVDRYHKEGHIVIMAGDGINDALALSKSDIALAMGSGADISVEVSDVVLMDDKITSLRDAIKLSKATYRNIKQNLLLSLTYNALTIPLAVAGYVIPLVAALSMSLSSLLVIANALRIKNVFKKER